MYSVRVGATAALYTRKDIQVKIVLRVESHPATKASAVDSTTTLQVVLQPNSKKREGRVTNVPIWGSNYCAALDCHQERREMVFTTPMNGLGEERGWKEVF